MDYPRYDPLSPVTPLSAKELQSLDHLLLHLPTDAAMTLDGVDGYLTALVIGPPTVLATLPTAEWLPLVWGGDDDAQADGAVASSSPFTSRRQRKDTVVQVLRHLRHLADQLQRASDEWQPIFSIAEQGTEEWADARDWCTGFLQAVDLAPQAWGDSFTAPGLAEMLAPLLLLGGGLEGAPLADEALADLEDPQACDALSRVVPEAVLQLKARFAA